MSRDVERRPAVIFLKLVIAVGVAPYVLGQAPYPGSLQATTGLYAQVAAAGIGAGCLASVAGIIVAWRGERLRGERGQRRQLDGWVIEQFGLIPLGIGAVMYAYALLRNAALWNAFALALILVGLAVFAAAQAVIVGRHRRRYIVKPRGRSRGVTSGE